MRFLNHILLDGCRFAFIPLIVVLTLVCAGSGGGEQASDFLNRVSFFLFVAPCLLFAFNGFAKRVYRESVVLRYGRKRILIISFVALMFISFILSGISALFVIIAVPSAVDETMWYWLCLICQIFLMGMWFDLLQLMTKRIYAFLLLFLCGMMEFASTFMPIGIQLSNPLVWNYSLFSEPAYTYGTDILKAIAVAAGLYFAKKYILVRRTDFFYG